MFVSDFITADDGSVRKIVELSQLDEFEYVIDELEVPEEEFIESNTNLGLDEVPEDVVQILMDLAGWLPLIKITRSGSSAVMRTI